MKYKLIKEYPGSPKLNVVIDDEITTFGVSFAKNNLNSIENHSEFWQPIVEKDYEILSFINLDNNKTYCLNKTHYFIKNNNSELLEAGSRSLDYCIKFYKIHSVKRLSDGEIFTIGDKLDCKGWFGNITKFEMINNELKIFQQQHINSSKYKPLLIQELIKVKQPLFTTEDGVDIYKGDIVWHTDISNFKTFSSIVEYEKPFEPIKGLFSTKEAAEEYILLNKPCLSLNDLKQFFPDTYIPFKKRESATEDVNTKQLEDLVKSKIQQSV